MRVRNSFGMTHINPGSVIRLSETRYKLDYTRRFYLFDVVPMGAPRMTELGYLKKKTTNYTPSEKAYLDVVKNYFAYRNILLKQAQNMNFILGEYLDIVFFMPMPLSWSEKKKERMNGTPCKVKPDTDNLVKAIMDTFKKQDSDIWYQKAEKRWADLGSILIFA